jgi:nitrogen fixation NifU-like protein
MGAYEMYQAQVLDHYRNPRNRGSLPDPDIRHRESNPLCGDEIEFHLKLDAKGKVKDVRFDGHGCAISLASASMLSEKVKGMTIKKIVKMTKDDVLGMLGVPLTPARLKCALIPLDALIQGIIEYGKARSH